MNATVAALTAGGIAAVMLIVSLVVGNLPAAGLFVVVLAVGAATVPGAISKHSK